MSRRHTLACVCLMCVSDTIVDSDLVLVMDKGVVGEFGSPMDLIGNPMGLFSQLLAVRVWMMTL